jgi:hypothetical protein
VRRTNDWRTALSPDDAEWFRQLCDDEEFLLDVAHLVYITGDRTIPHPKESIIREWQPLLNGAQELRDRINASDWWEFQEGSTLTAPLLTELDRFIAMASDRLDALRARPDGVTKRNPAWERVIRELADTFIRHGLSPSRTRGGIFEQAVHRVFVLGRELMRGWPEHFAPKVPSPSYIHDIARRALSD